MKLVAHRFGTAGYTPLYVASAQSTPILRLQRNSLVRLQHSILIQHGAPLTMRGAALTTRGAPCPRILTHLSISLSNAYVDPGPLPLSTYSLSDQGTFGDVVTPDALHSTLYALQNKPSLVCSLSHVN